MCLATAKCGQLQPSTKTTVQVNIKKNRRKHNQMYNMKLTRYKSMKINSTQQLQQEQQQ
jgi:hypothetical protein